MTDEIPEKAKATTVKARRVPDMDVAQVATFGRDQHDIMYDLAEAVFNFTILSWKARGMYAGIAAHIKEKCRDIRARGSTKTFYKKNQTAFMIDFCTLKTWMEEFPLDKFKGRTYGVHPDTGLVYYWSSEIFDDEDDDNSDGGPSENAPIPSF